MIWTNKDTSFKAVEGIFTIILERSKKHSDIWHAFFYIYTREVCSFGIDEPIDKAQLFAEDQLRNYLTSIHNETEIFLFKQDRTKNSSLQTCASCGRPSTTRICKECVK